MMAPRVYNGKKDTPITSANNIEAIIPLDEEVDGTIFVSLAAYRDAERCAETIQSLFENADNPDKVFIGLIEQINSEQDRSCLQIYCAHARKQQQGSKRQQKSCPRSDSQIRKIAIHHYSAKGPMYARSLGRKALGDEEYCLQIDAHSMVVPHWDTLLRDEFAVIGNEFGIISTVPPPVDGMKELMPGGVRQTEVPRTCAIRFQENGFPDYHSPADGKVFDLEEPLLSLGWSAAFSFSKCHLEEAVPYDPFATYSKPIEQFSRYMRLWTRGYDTYTPTRNIVFHDYGPNPVEGIRKDEWYAPRRNRFRKAAIQRVKLAAGMRPEATSTQIANLGLYGPGKRRTMEQLQEFINIKLATKKGNVGENLLCGNLDYVKYERHVSPTANLHDQPDDLEPQPDFPLRTELSFEHGLDMYVDPDFISKLDDDAAASEQEETTSMVAESSTSRVPWVVPVLWITGLVVWTLIFGLSRKGRKQKSRRSNSSKTA